MSKAERAVWLVLWVLVAMGVACVVQICIKAWEWLT